MPRAQKMAIHTLPVRLIASASQTAKSNRDRFENINPVANQPVTPQQISYPHPDEIQITVGKKVTSVTDHAKAS
jgi:hypothetical protein